MINILNEPAIRMGQSSYSRVVMSLPETYAALMADEVDAFPALRPHQRHAWHAFLVQLGAMAMHRADRTEPPEDAEAWSKLIRGLSPDYPDDEPWHLVVDDITRPAFMQPPARSADKENEYKGVAATPDALDMLVTSKNFDLKAAMGAQAGVDDWIFALITLQTMEGYGGARNYGISRMPSGYGNRPAFSITPSVPLDALRPGGHIRRDIAALLQFRPAILSEYPVTDDGIGLVWTKSWNGTKAEALLVNQLEPFYIEVCRRVRLREADGALEAVRANSLSRRIIDIKGLTGDPWAPVGKATKQRETPPAFLGHRKFGYERIVDGLFSPDWEPSRLLRLTTHDGNTEGSMHLVARGVVRGEGGTAGYHERIIPLTPKTAQVFGRGGRKEDIGDIARQRVEQIGKVKNILRHAIATFLARGEPGDTTAEQRSLANRWVDKIDEIVDAEFFEHLQDESDCEHSDDRSSVRRMWLRNGKEGVVDHAARLLQAAESALPCPSIHRYKARAEAENMFWGRLKGVNGLPFLFDRKNTNEESYGCLSDNQLTTE